MDFDCISCVYEKCDYNTKLAIGLTNRKLYAYSEPTRKARSVIRRVLTRSTVSRHAIIMADTLLTIVYLITCYSIWFVVYYYVL